MFEIAACANFVFETAFNIVENHKSKIHSSKFHNPQNLTPQEYGADQGWRLLLKTELHNPPKDTQCYSGTVSWFRVECLDVSDDGCSYRTRAPLPVEETQWIKMSDRKPTEADLPVAIGGRSSHSAPAWMIALCRSNSDISGAGPAWTHWRSLRAELTPPTPNPMTQQEFDQRAFKEWSEGEPESRYIAQESRAWHYAIAYERAKYRALVDRYNNSDLKAHEFIHAVAEMCK